MGNWLGCDTGLILSDPPWNPFAGQRSNVFHKSIVHQVVTLPPAVTSCDPAISVSPPANLQSNIYSTEANRSVGWIYDYHQSFLGFFCILTRVCSSLFDLSSLDLKTEWSTESKGVFLKQGLPLTCCSVYWDPHHNCFCASVVTGDFWQEAQDIWCVFHIFIENFLLATLDDNKNNLQNNYKKKYQLQRCSTFNQTKPNCFSAEIKQQKRRPKNKQSTNY